MIDPVVFQKNLDAFQIKGSDLWKAWLPLVDEIKVPSEHCLLRTGDEQHYIYVIKQGLVRFFYTSPKGKEWNKSFYAQGQVIGSLSAHLTQSPARFTIETLEPSTLYRTPIHEFWSIVQNIPEGLRLIQKITQSQFLLNELRESILLTGNAQERFDWLAENEQWLLQRKVPQYHLASYLGMDAVSFSRLKSKRSKTEE